MIDIVKIQKKVSKMSLKQRIRYIREHDDIEKYNIDSSCFSILMNDDNTKQIVVMLMKKMLISN